MGWYRLQFPIRLPGTFSGEATPWMLFHPEAPLRALEVLSRPRFIVLLRNPIDRAHSHYWHARRSGNEPLEQFEQAIEAEPKRLLIGEEVSQQRHSYLARGRYAEQLERWFGVFDRSAFLVLPAEDLFRSPASTTSRIAEWVGLRPFTPRTTAIHNEGRQPPIALDTRRALSEYYAPHNDRLEALLGRSFPWS